MSVLFMEGFDDRLYLVRGTGSITLATGLHGYYAKDMGDTQNKYLALRAPLDMNGSDTLIYGMRIQIRSWGAAYYDLVEDAFGAAVDIKMGATNTQFSVTINGNLLQTPVDSIPYGQWGHLAVKVVFHATAGSITWQVNGVEVATSTGLDTGTAPTTISPQWGNTTTNDVDYWDVDDIYVANGDGAFGNDFLGEAVVSAHMPSGNGNSSGMTGSDGNQVDNHLLVDNNAATPPAATEYVGSATEGHKDTYAMDDLVSTAVEVHAVETAVYAIKSDGFPKFMRPVLRSGSVDYVAASVALSETVWGIFDMWEQDPNTSAQWTPANVNAMEVGQEVRDS